METRGPMHGMAVWAAMISITYKTIRTGTCTVYPPATATLKSTGKWRRPPTSFFSGVMEGLIQAARGPLRVPMPRAPNDLARREGQPEIVSHRRRRQVLVEPLHLVAAGARPTGTPAPALNHATCPCPSSAPAGVGGEAPSLLSAAT
jgi:hypothetical protein